MVTRDATIADGPEHCGIRVMYYATPEDTWSRGLGSLLDRVSKPFDVQGVLLLDKEGARELKLPTGPDDQTTIGQDDARAAGWITGKPHAWTPFRRDGKTIIVGITSWPAITRCPLVDLGDEASTVERLAIWHDMIGRAWSGTPGVFGADLLKALAPKWKVNGRQMGPAYGYPDGPPSGEAYELDYKPEDWSRPLTLRYAHSYDATRAGLAAAGVCESLAAWTLKRTGRIPFDPTRAGWWKIELGPWNFDRLPAPAGPGESVRWVTTPTLELLTELREAGGEFQDFEVLDSWTGPGKRIMRKWAETLDGVYRQARDLVADPDSPTTTQEADAAAILATVKAVFRQTSGLLAYVPEGGVHNATFRPDWHGALVALARSNGWRRMWTIGRRESRWPVEIDADNVWYESDDPDPERSRPAGLPRLNRAGRSDTLGTFKTKGTRERQS